MSSSHLFLGLPIALLVRHADHEGTPQGNTQRAEKTPRVKSHPLLFDLHDHVQRLAIIPENVVLAVLVPRKFQSEMGLDWSDEMQPPTMLPSCLACLRAESQTKDKRMCQYPSRVCRTLEVSRSFAVTSQPYHPETCTVLTQESVWPLHRSMRQNATNVENGRWHSNFSLHRPPDGKRNMTLLKVLSVLTNDMRRQLTERSLHVEGGG